MWTSSAETSRVTEPLGSGVSVLSIVPAALIIAIGAFLAFSIAVGTLVIVIVANRAEPDRSGWRPWSVYFFGMSFISVFVTLFGTFAIVLGLVQLIGTHPGSGLGFPSSVAAHPIGDAVTRVVVMSALITVAGAVLLATHIRRGLALPEWRRGEHGPINRVAQSYVGAVCFVSLVIAASAFVSAGYQLFRVIAPGIFEIIRTEGGRGARSSGFSVPDDRVDIRRRHARPDTTWRLLQIRRCALGPRRWSSSAPRRRF